MSKNKRFDNFYYHRERDYDEIDWVRPKDFTQLTLKRPVVLINGAYDILTPARMRLIFAAAHKAGTLVCALDTDDKVAREKGPQRPILSFIERAACLNYMPIHYIVPINNKADMTWLIHYLKPDLRVQGADYADKPSRYKTRKMLVREGALHTTTLIERILKRYEKEPTLELQVNRDIIEEVSKKT